MKGVKWTNEPGEACEMQVGYVVFLGQHEPSNPMQMNVTNCNFSAQNTIDFYLTGYIWSSFKTWVNLPA